MSATQYRLLLVASILVGIVGSALDFVFPSLIPEAFHAAQLAQDEALIAQGFMWPSIFSVVSLLLFIASVYGLYCFRWWAPRLSVIATLAALVIWPLSGAIAQSGPAVAICY